MSRSRVAVISFPGSNGDHDALHALAEDVGVDAVMVDYRQTALDGFDAVVLPGGFSYGDALRCGAIARFAPVMTPLRAFAGSGGPVLGICNGFQILSEAHLLPGALLRNRTLRFHSFPMRVRVEDNRSSWLRSCAVGEALGLPVAHGEGACFVDDDTLARLEDAGQVALRYVGAAGSPDDSDANPNGSVAGIAGLTNEAGNVLGLMPHPERATDTLIGSDDGLKIFAWLREAGASEARAS